MGIEKKKSQEYPRNIDLVGMEKKKSQEYPRNIDLVGIEWVWRRKRAKDTQGILT